MTFRHETNGNELEGDTDLKALLSALRDELSPPQREKLEAVLSLFKDQVQQALVSQGRAVTDISLMLSKL
jgi:hypothetical protein